MLGILWRWGRGWLENKGLAGVAAVLEDKAAESGSLDALHAKARRALAEGREEDAHAALDQAQRLNPDSAALWCSRGAVFRHAGQFAEARAAYEQALGLDPRFVQAMTNLGEWSLVQGRPEEALVWLERALQIEPEFFEAEANRVAVLFELGRYTEAREAGEALVAREPGRPEPYVNLGNVLVHTGQAKQAVKLYRKALELRPGYQEAHFNIATLLGSQDDLAKSIGHLKREIELRGESAHRLGLLAAAYQAAGQVSEAAEYCRKVLERQPENPGALLTLASCTSTAGDAQAALALYERIEQLSARQASMGSNVLFELNYLPGYSREAVFERHLAWAQRYVPALEERPDFSGWMPEPDRKLRIAYVSGDFCAHPVGFLLGDVLRHHDRSRYEIHCFSMLLRPDEMSRSIQSAADGWEDVFLLNDDEFAALVRDKQIDVLIDLSGHTALHRLPALARRLAPVQATWIGYFHSTGAPEIDYFITDPHTSPPDNGQLFSETPVCLPHSRFCFSRLGYAPEVGDPPASRHGYVTFGSFNRLAKLVPPVVDAWAEILRAVPGSRLVIKAGVLKDAATKARWQSAFSERGIAPERIDLRLSSPHREMLEEYGDIDLALDPFPFNGGMTTLEALWMGVPVLTLEGDTVVSRQTHAALKTIGLAEQLSMPSIERYIARAVELAGDTAALAGLRAEIRPRMRASPLCQPDVFTRDLEHLYRAMWQAWCAGGKLPAYHQLEPTRGEPAAAV